MPTFDPSQAEAFARTFPALADRLAAPSTDPDVERLVEGFAELAGRIERVLDATARQTTAHFAELLAPEILRPFPAATVLELTHLASSARAAVRVEAGAEFDAIAIDGARCRFAAHAPFLLVPWRVADVRRSGASGRAAALEIVLASVGPARALSTALPLRLHLHGVARGVFQLLAFVHEHLVGAEISVGDHVVPLDARAVRPWGLARDEALLPVEPFEHPGFRLVRELLILPAKFAFLDVAGPVEGTAVAAHATLRLRFDAALPSALPLESDTFRSNCVPVINCFAVSADPIRPSLERPTPVVRPAGFRPEHAEVYAVRDARVRFDGGHVVELPPLTAFGATSAATSARYVLVRAPSLSRAGVDVTMTPTRLTDESGAAAIEVISFDLWATNRALASPLGVGDVRIPSAMSPPGFAFKNISSVTPYRAAPQGDALTWRTLALVALSARELASRDSLRTLLHALNLHALDDSQAARAHAQRLEGIAGLSSRATMASIGGTHVRGHDVELSLDDSAFDGEGEAFLFAQVVARMLAHEASLNAFVRITARLVTTGRTFRFAPQNGDESLG